MMWPHQSHHITGAARWGRRVQHLTCARLVYCRIPLWQCAVARVKECVHFAGLVTQRESTIPPQENNQAHAPIMLLLYAVSFSRRAIKRFQQTGAPRCPREFFELTAPFLPGACSLHSVLRQIHSHV
jgi:hypothetical protein